LVVFDANYEKTYSLTADAKNIECYITIIFLTKNKIKVAVVPWEMSNKYSNKTYGRRKLLFPITRLQGLSY